MQIDSWGTDGEEVQITMPSELEISNLVSMSQKQYQNRIGKLKLSLLGQEYILYNLNRLWHAPSLFFFAPLQFFLSMLHRSSFCFIAVLFASSEFFLLHRGSFYFFCLKPIWSCSIAVPFASFALLFHCHNLISCRQYRIHLTGFTFWFMLLNCELQKLQSVSQRLNTLQEGRALNFQELLLNWKVVIGVLKWFPGLVVESLQWSINRQVCLLLCWQSTNPLICICD